MIGYNLITH